MEKAIIATLCYHDLFEYPLKKDEIWKYLIKLQNSRNPKLQKLSNKFKTILRGLVEEKKIGKKKKYYFLKRRERIVGVRIKREEYSKEKIKIAKTWKRERSIG